MARPKEVVVTDRMMRLMGSGRVFKENSARINSLDFHRTEDILVTASDDDSIRVYNTASGFLADTLYSRKYGVSNLCVTHAQSCAIYSTRKSPVSSSDLSWYALRYHDLRRNEYVRYFKGHQGPLNTVAMSPKNDTVMSASQDKTVRLWDLRTNICQGLMQVPGNPCAAYDQQGLVFGVATESGIIKLYDVRSYDKGPFDTFSITEEANSPLAISDLRFSNDGKLMLAVSEGKVYVLDAFNGSVLCRCPTGSTEGAPPLEAAFSPDNQYLLSGAWQVQPLQELRMNLIGCEDRTVRVWSLATREVVSIWRGHAGVPACLKFAPRRLLVASACQALVLWVPALAALELR
ncbi:hypothetical protein QJQ45_026480 [Haematococcus lacustris]|nr:hypothetical protein QJQ45_026480 [Haematococcus lacustris]